MNKLSIVIPVYNRWNFTKSCLKDFSNISKDYEIIIIDNGSVDNTQKEIISFKDIIKNFIYIRNDNNTGFGAAVNLGFSKASSDLVMFLNNDIRITNKNFDWLDEFVEFVKNHNNCLIGPTGGFVDDNFNFKYETNSNDRKINYMSGWCLTSNVDTWNKLIINNNIGPFDAETYFAYFEDTDLGFRAKQENINFILYDLPIVHFEKQTSKLLNTFKLYGESRKKFLKRWKK